MESSEPIRLPPWPEYLLDAWQRSVLYADVRRRRGNQYREHMREDAPNVLHFPSELVMSGRDLPRPVNYSLLRILPPQDRPVEPGKRPFVVVDPRAGHGPGIGGFKPDSEIGAALAAGHPCYFVGFLPHPVRGQTVEDVMRAEAAFLRRVAALHPESRGKPAVIGNCQAGWQILMTAAVWPELFGPIILPGAPLSYWAGRTPMRYTGGMTGGSWLTALTSDLGDGRFDGAWLVSNFEQLDPANTVWNKQYHLYANVDTEEERYLGFEKYWGGLVFLEDVEMQYIVDNLFIGNKLATAELVTSDGVRIDLRNIRSPIVVFCSYGDNITPPAQALGWITDLYRNEADLISHDQTIVYATHDSIGHLGIFVSGSVGRREHREFISNIDVIDLLPAGLFQAVVDDRPTQPAAPAGQDFLLSLHARDIEDVHAIVQPDVTSERRFAAAARVSEINLALYRNLAQPWVRAWANPQLAHWLQSVHPLRVGYQLWSDEHPAAVHVKRLAETVRANRRPAAPENPFLQLQALASSAIEGALDLYRDQRDAAIELAFEAIYGSPWLQALAGQTIGDDTPPRHHPGDSPEHRAFVQERARRLHESLSEGGLLEAAVRAIFHVLRTRGEADERHFRHALRLREMMAPEAPLEPAEFRRVVRRQALLLKLEPKASMAALPVLLASTPVARVREVGRGVEALVLATGDLGADERARLDEVIDVFGLRGTGRRRPSGAARPRRSPSRAAKGGKAVRAKAVRAKAVRA